MARPKGRVAYPGKEVNSVSVSMTKAAKLTLEEAEARTGRSASDVVEHAIRRVGPTLTTKSRKVRSQHDTSDYAPHTKGQFGEQADE